MGSTPKLRGLSEILTFFRKNETPIYFISPTAFNLLGVEKFVHRFYHCNYFDSFEGWHPRVFVPQELGYRDFQSMEEVCNYLLSHKEVSDRIRKGGKGPAKLIFVMFDEETEELRFELSVDLDPEVMKNVRLRLGQGIAGQVALTQKAGVAKTTTSGLSSARASSMDSRYRSGSGWAELVMVDRSSVSRSVGVLLRGAG